MPRLWIGLGKVRLANILLNQLLPFSCRNTRLNATKFQLPITEIAMYSAVSLGYGQLSPKSWWRHQMEIFSALLALCAAQRPVTRSFDVFFDLRLNKRLSKQSWGWWFETPSSPLWRHCNVLETFRRATAGEWVRGLGKYCHVWKISCNHIYVFKYTCVQNCLYI